jgi:5,10-methylenetetrahydrofolate reductase
MDEPIATAFATLQRWLTGPHFTALPMRSASHPAPTPSFEFFPPRTEVPEQQRCVNRLAPRFVSVTYGAGGTTQARTHVTVARIAKETSLAPAAAYPEGHPGVSNPVADLEKRKPDAGVTLAITQCFFDASTYLRFLDLFLAAGIKAPIVPAIMPVCNFAQAVKFSDKCGAGVPARMGRLFEGTENDPETRRMLGMIIAAEQVRLVQANRVDEFHFYTLNRSDLTYAIAHMLGFRAPVDRWGAA